MLVQCPTWSASSWHKSHTSIKEKEPVLCLHQDFWICCAVSVLYRHWVQVLPIPACSCKQDLKKRDGACLETITAGWAKGSNLIPANSVENNLFLKDFLGCSYVLRGVCIFLFYFLNVLIFVTLVVCWCSFSFPFSICPYHTVMKWLVSFFSSQFLSCHKAHPFLVRDPVIKVPSGSSLLYCSLVWLGLLKLFWVASKLLLAVTHNVFDLNLFL